MLTRLCLRNYKSLVDVTVHLPALVVLFGPNASGKSNLLDAIHLLARLATSQTLSDAFAPPYRGTPLESCTFGPQGLQGLLDQDTVSLTFDVDVVLSASICAAVNQRIREMTGLSAEPGAASPAHTLVRDTRLRYRIELAISPRAGILSVADEYLALLSDDHEPTTRHPPFLERVDHRLVLRQEGTNHHTAYDAGRDHTILSLPVYPPHYPHLVAMREELARWVVCAFEPRERMRVPSPLKDVRRIGTRGDDLAAVLHTLKTLNARQFQAVERAIHLIIPSMTGITVDINRYGEIDLHLLEGTTPLPVHTLSDGTLRILGLVAMMAVPDPPSLIGIEEPETGIHPRQLRMIADMLQTRTASQESQIIVTTHSPLLADLVPEESVYFCRKHHGHTTIAPMIPIPRLSARTRDDDAMDDDRLLLSERIVRGDFDG